MFTRYERKIVNELSQVLDKVDPSQVEALIEAMDQAQRIFFVGVGRVLLSLEAIAKRLNHLGYDTVVVGQITEPAITENDLLIVGSGSGETGFPVFIASKAKSFNAKVAHLGTNAKSSIAQYTDIFVYIPAANKYDPDVNPSIQPMTSLFEQSLLLVGDTIALILVKEKQIDMSSLWQYHANLE